jgi:hypothetical protein
MSTNTSRKEKTPLSYKVVALMDGQHCDDAICCEFGLPLEDLMALVGPEKVISLYSTGTRKEGEKEHLVHNGE